MKVKDNIKDIIEAIKETAKGNYVDEEVQKNRVKTCEECGNYTTVKIINTRHCNECLCDIDIKTWFKKMECPMGKWNGEE
jgi:hypothetical protein